MSQIEGPSLSADLLDGAGEIAEFMFGDKKHRRRVYHFIHAGQIPVFRLGDRICARKSVLIARIEAEEQNSKREAA